MQIFECVKLGSSILKNRIIRSATYEGMCDSSGFPKDSYKNMYIELARNNISAIITGYQRKDGQCRQGRQGWITMRRYNILGR